MDIPWSQAALGPEAEAIEGSLQPTTLSLLSFIVLNGLYLLLWIPTKTLIGGMMIYS